MFEVPPLCENESDDAPNGSYDLISSFGTYTNQKPHRVSLKKLGWINGVNPLAQTVTDKSEVATRFSLHTTVQ